MIQMRKTLTRKVPFGKAIARITVTAFDNDIRLDGQWVSTETIITKNVEIVAGGKVVESGHFATILEYNNARRIFDGAKLDPNQKYSRVGDKAITPGTEAAETINAAIKEMETELAHEAGMQTETEKRQAEEIADAQAVVAQAEKEGVDKLMTLAQWKVWRKQYNNLHNEGGEGYIPIRITREEYNRALETLKAVQA